MESLKLRAMHGLKPNYGGGRPSKLTEEQKEELKEILKEKDWTTKEVQELIEAEFGVIYSSWQVKRILKSFGMRYALSEGLQEAG